VTIGRHFGRAPFYAVLTIAGGKILAREKTHAQVEYVKDIQRILSYGAIKIEQVLREGNAA